MRRVAGWVLAAALVVGLQDVGSAGADSTRVGFERARDARHRDSDQRIWQRRLSIRALESAAGRAPTDVTTLDRLGEAYLDGGFFHRARATFERSLALDSIDADAQFGLGRIDQREWLESLDAGTLQSVERRFEAAVRARPEFYQAWVALAVIRFERRDPWAARDAAWVAWALAPESVEAQVAAAYLGYRTGLVERSDSLFAVAIPRCPAGIAERFSDITPLLSELEQQDFQELDGASRREYARRYWGRSDPDPTTPQNEARLEFGSRVAHALLLIGDPWGPRWAARTDLYSRYGRLVQIGREFDSPRTEMPHVEWGEVAVDPTPQALERLGQNTVGTGHAIFAPLPPGVNERPLRALVSRFEGPRGVRVAAMVETPGTPADSIVADCVVVGADDRVMARGTRVLSPSACDPSDRRAGAFTFDLPAGRYRLAIAVRDAVGGRGVHQVNQEIGSASAGLALSDLVLACGEASTASEGAIVLNPNLDARVEDQQPLLAYFEVYHLSLDEHGESEFEYEYAVDGLRGHSSRPSRRSPARPGEPRLSFRSTQNGVGTLRRQFVSIPAASLAPGRYRLRLMVRDARTGAKTERTADFIKAAPASEPEVRLESDPGTRP